MKFSNMLFIKKKKKANSIDIFLLTSIFQSYRIVIITNYNGEIKKLKYNL